MGIQKQGIDGEQKAFRFLWSKGLNGLQPDTLIRHKGKWFVLEVKNKGELFNPPPFYGTGLEVPQIKARMQFWQETGIRCIVIQFMIDQPNTVYYQFLDVLEKGKYFDTRRGIRIYHIDSWKKEIWIDPADKKTDTKQILDKSTTMA